MFPENHPVLDSKYLSVADLPPVLPVSPTEQQRLHQSHPTQQGQNGKCVARWCSALWEAPVLPLVASIMGGTGVWRVYEWVDTRGLSESGNDIKQNNCLKKMATMKSF